MFKNEATTGFKTLGGGRNALVVWVLGISAVEWLNSLKIERLLTRIRSCTTLFCYVKNKFQEKSPPLLGRGVENSNLKNSSTYKKMKGKKL